MQVMICTTHFPHCAEVLRKHLPDDTVSAYPAEQVVERAAEADVLVPAMYRVDARVIDHTSATLINQFGVGIEGVDIPAATRRGIYVANVPGHEGAGNAVSVSEHALFLMLSLARRYPQAQQSIHHRVLGTPLGTTLMGKTVAILGLGSIGRQLALRLEPFKVRLLGIKHHPSEALKHELGLDFLGTQKDLARVLEQADFVVLALPVTSATRAMLDAVAFAEMKNTAFVINVARGPVIDHDALLNALAEGQIAGAGLDVFWDEPTDPNDPLFQYNVIATPHTAGVTDLSYHDIARGLAANVNRIRAGQLPLNCANLKAVQARQG